MINGEHADDQHTDDQQQIQYTIYTYIQHKRHNDQTDNITLQLYKCTNTLT